MTKKALIIFTRNPELGKCKTRLAKTVGDESALNIYKYLLQHTADIAKKVNAARYVFYSQNINIKDIWSSDLFNKKLQKGEDLGLRMYNAFLELLDHGYEKVIIIGSDLLDLNETIIEQAFDELSLNDVVIGPADDGGYYLLGMKTMHQQLFKNKDWGTDTVRKATLNNLKNSSVSLLDNLNDIDTFEDMKHYKTLKQFYN
ncbi:TIGR04282 family arsenosugar biosynthesis glycosyltransferase [Winogradskyella sp. UBA3174]|uniref:TIGR04282 family arsenosugar biosynthesis glycosyltransferase n=1 Tax=Winogradskyella sp. UBA3174 TaxID=1947785 RepID=UPI0025ED9A2F|nr:TIGR04282 family arsenosugar biosynthesis glycosyltransferase [Winogradskyella sp. UBA3174]|tara:strand:+ start:11562 stop:12164 length:603 start_codon:yes stop_codon:yes gene_type:complete